MQKTFLVLLVLIALSFNSIQAQNPVIDSLLKTLPTSKEDTSKVIAYRMLAGLVRSTDPLKAVEYGKAGVFLGKKLGFDKGVAGCLLNISACYNSASKLDSALAYIDTAIYYSHRAIDPNRLALAYLNRADIYMQLNNLNQSLKDCDTSLQFAEKANNDDRRARVFQTIGSVYYMQEQWQQSAGYYDKAYKLYNKIGNKQMSAIVLNNNGNVYKHLGNYEKSITSFLNAITIGDSLKDFNNLSMYHENLSDAYLQANNIQLAEKYAILSMDFAVKQNNKTQMATAYECLGSVYLKQQKFSQAIEAGQKAFNLSKKENNINIQFESSDLLAEAFSKSGDPGMAFEFLKINKEINDSLTKQQFAKDIAAMQTSFKVDEKDKEILLLGKDKEIQQQKLKQQRFLLITSAAIGLLAILGIGLLINRNRLRQQMKELELRNQIAADLHDEVGSSLSSIHMLSQIATQQPGSDTAHKDILTRMSINAKETMDKMGDIVWMIKAGESEGSSLKERMERFAYEICSSKNIDTIIELDELEKVKLTMEQRKNLYLIFKEALNNAVKYSGAEKVEIKVQSANKQLQLLIKDYGKGFKPETTGRGNGLDNMKNRAKELNGHLEILAEPGQGTVVQLTIPL